MTFKKRATFGADNFAEINHLDRRFVRDAGIKVPLLVSIPVEKNSAQGQISQSWGYRHFFVANAPCVCFCPSVKEIRSGTDGIVFPASDALMAARNALTTAPT